MNIRPLLSALTRHRASVVLLVLEIALTFAVVSNALGLVMHRVAKLQLRTGLDDTHLVYVDTDGTNAADKGAIYTTILHALRRIPGVQAAASVNTVPFGPRGGTVGFYLDESEKRFGKVSDFYWGSPGYLDVLGVRVIRGRSFDPSAYRDFGTMPASGGVIISQKLATQLWPGQDALGKSIWLGKKTRYQVIGVAAPVLRPDPGYAGIGDAYDTLFLPAAPGASETGSFVLRTDAPQRQAVLHDAFAAITRIDPTLVIERDSSGSITDLRRSYEKNNRIMIGMLGGVIVALMLVTGLGIMGLTGFWVQQRTRQIGVRRALGARRVDILRYFQTENFLLATLGIALGCAAAIGINVWLMAHYAVPRLPIVYLPIGAVALWLLGQLAVLGPALRAARVPPTTAMRAA
ncbi:MAG: ABC transporter permease [Vulcanimicrobiaceae bacterium]|jgi:putative ABC transport system permease protein